MKRTGKLFALLTVSVAFCQFPCIAATPCNLRIAEYPGSSEKEGRVGTIDVFAIDHEIMVPIDPVTGLLSGRRQHKPLTVLKQVDRSSPGLCLALATNQLLHEVILDFYHVNPVTQMEEKYYTITLTSAHVVGIKLMMPTAFDPAYGDYGHMEEIRFVYQSIEWHWIPDNIRTGDDWQAIPSREVESTPQSDAPAPRIDAPDAAREEGHETPSVGDGP